VKLPRRKFLHLAAAAAALPAVSPFAWAQAYPTRPVRIVVGFPPGGNSDVLARLIAQWLSEHLGQPFIVENRPGAASNIAADAVSRARPDGYTLLWEGVNNPINATLYNKLDFDFIRDIMPVAGVTRGAFVMAINPSVPAKNVPEFIAYAQANPGKISFASSGTGGANHLIGELFNMLARVKMIHVPYRGDAPAITDLISGQVQIYFATLAASIEHIRAGKLRALAVTTAMRSQALPDIPTVNDFVAGCEAILWNGLGAPKDTPAEIVEKLNVEVNRALLDPKITARLADLGSEPLGGSPADLRKLIAEETEKWGKVIRATNIKAE
jgi:tripartite-type tricarboxylate transporter receptor subunit TctC